MVAYLRHLVFEVRRLPVHHVLRLRRIIHERLPLTYVGHKNLAPFVSFSYDEDEERRKRENNGLHTCMRRKSDKGDDKAKA